jgi:hypothetical protein
MYVVGAALMTPMTQPPSEPLRPSPYKSKKRVRIEGIAFARLFQNPTDSIVRKLARQEAKKPCCGLHRSLQSWVLGLLYWGLGGVPGIHPENYTSAPLPLQEHCCIVLRPSPYKSKNPEVG